MRSHHVRSLAAALAAVALAACGSDSSTAPRNGGSLDLSAALNEISTGSPASFSGAPVAAVSAGSSASVAWVPSQCAYSSTSKGFACPAITTNGITINRSFFLYDASGASQSAADASTTASVRTVTDISGTLAAPSGSNISGSIAITRHDDVTLSGLLTGKHTLNGSGSGHTDTQFGGQAAQRIVIDETSKTTNLVLAGKGSNSIFPQSGSIALDQTIAASGSGSTLTTTMHETMTFDGTSVVTIEFTIGGQSRTCKLNLANFAASTGCSL